jgi:hypothetical protein
MTPEQWEKVSDIFHSVAALDPEKRAAYLDQACDGDETLMRRRRSSSKHRW